MGELPIGGPTNRYGSSRHLPQAPVCPSRRSAHRHPKAPDRSARRSCGPPSGKPSTAPTRDQRSSLPTVQRVRFGHPNPLPDVPQLGLRRILHVIASRSPQVVTKVIGSLGKLRGVQAVDTQRVMRRALESLQRRDSTKPQVLDRGALHRSLTNRSGLRYVNRNVFAHRLHSTGTLRRSLDQNITDRGCSRSSSSPRLCPRPCTAVAHAPASQSRRALIGKLRSVYTSHRSLR